MKHTLASQNQAGFAMGTILMVIVAVGFIASVAALMIAPQIGAVFGLEEGVTKERDIVVAKTLLLQEVRFQDNVPVSQPAQMLSGVDVQVYGGQIPLTSAAPRMQKNVRYCAYNRSKSQDLEGYTRMPVVHSTVASLKYPLFAFIDSGEDGEFSTTCISAAKGIAQKDDEVTMTIAALIPKDALEEQLLKEKRFAKLPSKKCEPTEKLVYVSETNSLSDEKGYWDCRTETDETAPGYSKISLNPYCKVSDAISINPDYVYTETPNPENPSDWPFICEELNNAFDIEGEVITSSNFETYEISDPTSSSEDIQFKDAEGNLLFKHGRVTAVCSAEEPWTAVEVILKVDYESGEDRELTICRIDVQENESGDEVSITNSLTFPVTENVTDIEIETVRGVIAMEVRPDEY